MYAAALDLWKHRSMQRRRRSNFSKAWRVLAQNVVGVVDRANVGMHPSARRMNSQFSARMNVAKHMASKRGLYAFASLQDMSPAVDLLCYAKSEARRGSRGRHKISRGPAFPLPTWLAVYREQRVRALPGRRVHPSRPRRRDLEQPLVQDRHHDPVRPKVCLSAAAPQ